MFIIGENKWGDSIWSCFCDCGKMVDVTRNHLISGSTKSCGCLNRDSRSEQCRKRNTRHSMSGTRIYNQWILMRRRCNPDPQKNPDYNHYAGRGIICDPTWSKFEQFYRDMGEPQANQELDRIDNNGPYSKENCRWVDRKRQMRNTRRNRVYDIDGTMLSMVEIAERFQINYNTLRSRLYILKLDIESALNYDRIRWIPQNKEHQNDS